MMVFGLQWTDHQEHQNSSLLNEEVTDQFVLAAESRDQFATDEHVEDLEKSGNCLALDFLVCERFYTQLEYRFYYLHVFAYYFLVTVHFEYVLEYLKICFRISKLIDSSSKILHINSRLS
jgi:hypothetical protein